MSRRSPLCIKRPLCTSQIGKEEKPSKRQNISVCPLHSHARAPRERERDRERERGVCGWVALGNVMAPPRQQQRQRRPVAALLVLLSLCCLARLGAAASAASTGPDRKDGTALDKAAPQEEEAARGFTVTTVEEQGRGRGPVRVVTEVDIEDYPRYGANGRHNPEGPHP